MFDIRGIKVFYCSSIYGESKKALKNVSRFNLRDNDYANVTDRTDGNQILHFVYTSDLKQAEQTTTHPYIIRPIDYQDDIGGVWEECQYSLSGVITERIYPFTQEDWSETGEEYECVIPHDIQSVLSACYRITDDANESNIVIPNGFELSETTATIKVISDPDCRFAGKLILTGLG